MEIERTDSRAPNQLRKVIFKKNILNQPHGSVRCSQGATDVIVSVKGPLAGIKKNENPEKACIDVIWRPRTGEKGKVEKEYEMILKRTLQSICILTIHPNTTTTVQVQVVHDDGALLPCAINAASAALVDAGIPLKHLAVAVCCCVAENGSIILDPTKQEEEGELGDPPYVALMAAGNKNKNNKKKQNSKEKTVEASSPCFPIADSLEGVAEDLNDIDTTANIILEEAQRNHTNPNLHEETPTKNHNQSNSDDQNRRVNTQEHGKNTTTDEPSPTTNHSNSSHHPHMSWKEILMNNSRPDSLTPLSYEPPQLHEGAPIALLDQSDLDQDINYWRHTLVGLVCGQRPSYTQMVSYVQEQWKNVTLPTIHSHDDGLFVFKFASESDMCTILEAGAWTFMNRPLLLRPWKPDFHFSMKEFQFLPVWVRLPSLPLMLWRPSTIGKLCSCIGTPIGLDAVTARKERISFARVLVEVDSHRALPDIILARHLDGSLLKQRVEYEWRPSFCTTCNIPGHLTGQCRNLQHQQPRMRRVWIRKSTKQPNTAKKVTTDNVN